MGKGDKKSKRGKIIMGSYGKSRLKKTAKKSGFSLEKNKVEEILVAKTADSKKTSKKTEVVVDENATNDIVNLTQANEQTETPKKTTKKSTKELSASPAPKKKSTKKDSETE